MRAKETTLLGNLAKIRTGKLDANASSDNGKYPFFTCAKNPLRINQYTYDCECILIAGNGDLNAKYYKGKFDAYQRTYIIEPTSNLINCKFLFYFLDTYLEELRRLSIGGVIKYIKLQNLTEAKIPLPPIDDQRRIAKILDHMRSLSNLLNKSCNLIEEKRHSIMNNFLDKGELHSLKSVSEIQIGPFGSLLHKSDYIEGGIPVINPKHICKGLINADPAITIKASKAKRLSKYLISKGDVIMGRRGEMGRCAMVTD